VQATSCRSKALTGRGAGRRPGSRGSRTRATTPATDASPGGAIFRGLRRCAPVAVEPSVRASAPTLAERPRIARPAPPHSRRTPAQEGDGAGGMTRHPRRDDAGVGTWRARVRGPTSWTHVCPGWWCARVGAVGEARGRDEDVCKTLMRHHASSDVKEAASVARTGRHCSMLSISSFSRILRRIPKNKKPPSPRGPFSRPSRQIQVSSHSTEVVPRQIMRLGVSPKFCLYSCRAIGVMLSELVNSLKLGAFVQI
jgi:hypothetical protein